jgi:hypothetical protein
MRPAIVLIAFLPFLYYAIRDARFHFTGRKVTFAEHVIHLAIGLALAISLIQAVMGNSGLMLGGLLLLVVAGSADEYIWHRGIPEVETDLHAKEHLALLIFVVATLAVNWLEAHQWRIPRELLAMAAARAPATNTDGLAVAQLGGGVNPWWRGLLIPLCLVPYAYFGLSDNLHHFRHRSISWAEQILHATIVLALLTVVPHAIAGDRSVVVAGLILFLIARSADEWGFHRGLGGNEADMHAKTHFAFLIFVVMSMMIDWVADRVST